MALQAEQIYEGNVVSVHGDTLTTVGRDGFQHSHTLRKGCRVMCDAKPIRAADLSPGTYVRMRTKADDKTTVMSIETGEKIKDSTAEM